MRVPVGRFALFVASALFVAGAVLGLGASPSSTSCDSGAGGIPADCSVGNGFVVLEFFILGGIVLLLGAFGVLAQRSRP